MILMSHVSFLQSTTMMDTFMKLAKSNTNKNLETCGVLAGSLVSIWNFRLQFLCLNLYTEHFQLLYCRRTENFMLQHSSFPNRSRPQILYGYPFYFLQRSSYFSFSFKKYILQQISYGFYIKFYFLISVRLHMKRKYLKFKISDLFSPLVGFMWVP